MPTAILSHGPRRYTRRGPLAFVLLVLVVVSLVPVQLAAAQDVGQIVNTPALVPDDCPAAPPTGHYIKGTFTLHIGQHIMGTPSDPDDCLVYRQGSPDGSAVATFRSVAPQVPQGGTGVGNRFIPPDGWRAHATVMVCTGVGGVSSTVTNSTGFPNGTTDFTHGGGPCSSGQGSTGLVLGFAGYSRVVGQTGSSFGMSNSCTGQGPWGSNVCEGTSGYTRVWEWVPDAPMPFEGDGTCQGYLDHSDPLGLALDPLCWCPVYRPVAGYDAVRDRLTVAWHMEGPVLTYRQMAAYVVQQGWSGSVAADGVATARAESSLNALAVNDGNSDGSTDTGVWQINGDAQAHIPLLEVLYPPTATAWAREIFDTATGPLGPRWGPDGPWYGFDVRGQYQGAAAAAVQLVESTGGESEGYSFRRSRDRHIINDVDRIRVKAGSSSGAELIPLTPARQLETDEDGVFGWLEVDLGRQGVTFAGSRVVIEVPDNAPPSELSGLVYERCGIEVMVEGRADVRPGPPGEPALPDGSVVIPNPSTRQPGDGEDQDCGLTNPGCWFRPSTATSDRFGDLGHNAQTRVPWALAMAPQEWLGEDIRDPSCGGTPGCATVATSIELPIGGHGVRVPILGGAGAEGAEGGPMTSFFAGIRSLAGAVLWGFLLAGVAFWAFRQFAPGGGQ